MTGAVLTAGETMALFDPAEDGPPRAGTSYVLRAAGAESNFAVALARLGWMPAGCPASATTPWA